MKLAIVAVVALSSITLAASSGLAEQAPPGSQIPQYEKDAHTVRVSFWQVFQQAPGGGIAPRVPVQIGGITMSPGVSFGSGVAFGGVDLAAIAGRDLQVQTAGGVVIITGYY